MWASKKPPQNEHFYRFLFRAVFTCSFREESILGKRATGIALRLIHRLWVEYVRSLSDIMPFVDQYPAFILNPISVWSARTEAHENNAFAVSQAEVHPTLQIYADCRAHLHVGDDIAGLESSRQESLLNISVSCPSCVRENQ
jgi:hypothetical protein